MIGRIGKMFCCRKSTKSFTLVHDVDPPPKSDTIDTDSERTSRVGSVISVQPQPEPQGETQDETQLPTANGDVKEIISCPPVSNSHSHNQGGDEEDEEDDEDGEDVIDNRREGLRGQKVDTNVEIRTYGKTHSESGKIRRALLKNEFLRGMIPDNEMDNVIAAMSPMEVSANQIIIQQGVDGDEFYVSERGNYRILVGEEIFDTFNDERVFGELAVLYKNPRSATIEALSDGRIWKMDGQIFQALLIKSARNAEDERIRYLRKLPAVDNVSADKMHQIATLMKEAFYRGNTKIIRQGERGDRFFVIKAGKVRVTVEGKGDVAQLSEGQYFGEKALIEAEVRQASCIAEPPGVTCLEILRDDFDTYLGDFKDFVKEKPPSAIEETETRLSVDINAEQFDPPGLNDLAEIKTIGVGGFGRVVLTKDHRGNLFALKKLSKCENKSLEQREHTMNEKKIQSHCRSPFIVRLYCTYQNKKYLFFLLEACMGGDLFSLMQHQKGRCFEEDGAQFIAACVLEALAYLHNLHYIYRDLKPENMLIDTKGYIKLADFGFAKKVTGTGSTYTFAGTPEYVAPEVIYNKGHNRAVDYWAFGIFVFELLAGKTPFKTNDPSYMKTYGLILKGIENIQFPNRIKKDPANLIKKLCKLTPHERLGCQRRGVEDIREHKWFASINWAKLHEKTLPSKYVPHLKSVDDTRYFDTFDHQSFVEPENDNDIWPDF